MTENQRLHLYFPAWTAALKANWVTEKGTCTLVENPPGGDFARKVDVLAGQRAAAQFRTAKPDDLRHACHLIALGRSKSSKDLTNRELDKVLNQFRILIDQYDLKSSAAMVDPSADERRRLVWAVENCGMPAAYVAAIARSTQDCANWRTMDNRKLGLLVATLRSRRSARQPAGAPRTTGRTYRLKPRTEHEPI